jgi:transposase
LYDLLVPKENILRKINDLIDFSFIYDELLNKYCTTNGRMAESPVRMFKYLLLKTIYTVSDVDVVERSQYDMSFKYESRIRCYQSQFVDQIQKTTFERHRFIRSIDK